MVTNTQKIINDFHEIIDINKEYTRIELINILNDIFKNVKPKKNLSDYNLFVKNNITFVKNNNPDFTRQQLMCEVGKMWQKYKEEKSNNIDTKSENNQDENKEKTDNFNITENNQDENTENTENKENTENTHNSNIVENTENNKDENNEVKNKKVKKPKKEKTSNIKK